MKISYDPLKRQRCLEDRRLDFKDALRVFDTQVFSYADRRMDYGEERIICFGLLDGRLVVVGYVQRGEARHVFSMRKANRREQARFEIGGGDRVDR